jgi:RHS repeat-associated protein
VWDPYGQPAGATGATNLSVGYQGDYTDPTSGDVWMGARWYMPETGGFTSRDTVFGMLRTPVSLNRYTYANGDPLEYFDPDGRFGLSTLTKAVGSAWNNTGGRVASTVNRTIVQPVARSMPASVRANAAKLATFARSLPRKAASAYLAVRKARASAHQYVAQQQVGYIKGLAAGGYETAKGLVHLATNPTELVHLARAMVRDPGGTANAIYHGTVDPIEDAFERGEYGEAAGRAGFEVLSATLGPKGVTKAGSTITKGLRKAVKGLEEFAASPAGQKALTTLADETGAIGAGGEGVASEAGTTLERAAYNYATRPDKLDHVFAAKHKFEPLVQQFGSREAVVRQMLDGIKGLTPASGTFEIAIRIGGQDVVVRGAVVNGVAKIGTAFTP